MRAAVVAAIIALLLSACGQGSDRREFSGEIGNLIADAQAAGLDEDSHHFKALEDGVVTLEEYREGFAGALACVQDHGIVVERQYVNKYDSWRLGWMPDVERSLPQEGENDWSARCSVEHVMYLELGYALNAKDRVDARVLANASGCLADIGGSIDPGAQSVAALVEGTGDRDAVLTCLGASMQQLFPDEPAAYVE